MARILLPSSQSLPLRMPAKWPNQKGFGWLQTCVTLYSRFLLSCGLSKATAQQKPRIQSYAGVQPSETLLIQPFCREGCVVGGFPFEVSGVYSIQFASASFR